MLTAVVSAVCASRSGSLCVVSALLAAVKCVWSRVGSPSIRGSWPSFTRLVGVDSTCGSGGDRPRRAGSVLLLLVRQGLPWWPVSIRRGRAVQPVTASVGDGWGCFSPLLGLWCRALPGLAPGCSLTVRAGKGWSLLCFGSWRNVHYSVVNRRGQTPVALPNAPSWRSSAPRSCTGLFCCACVGVPVLAAGPQYGGCGPALGGLIVDKLSPLLRRSRR